MSNIIKSIVDFFRNIFNKFPKSTTNNYSNLEEFEQRVLGSKSNDFISKLQRLFGVKKKKIKTTVEIIDFEHAEEKLREMESINPNLENDQRDMITLIRCQIDAAEFFENTFFVAKNEEGKACGIGVLRRMNNKDYVQGVVCAFKRRGVGTDIGKEMLEYSRKRQGKRVPIETTALNDNLKRLYMLKGFIEVKEGTTNPRLLRRNPSTENLQEGSSLSHHTSGNSSRQTRGRGI